VLGHVVLLDDGLVLFGGRLLSSVGSFTSLHRLLLGGISRGVLGSVGSSVFGGNLALIFSAIASCVLKFLSYNCRSGVINCGI